MERLNRYVTKLDRYGARVQLNYEGKETYQNPIGGCLTLMVFTLILIYGCKLFIGLLITSEPIQFSYTIETDLSQSYSFDLENRIVIQIRNISTNELTYFPDSIGNLEIV